MSPLFCHAVETTAGQFKPDVVRVVARDMGTSGTLPLAAQMLPGQGPSTPPAKSAPLRRLPPLSLNDCIDIVNRALDGVQIPPDAPAEELARHSNDLVQLIGTAYNYLNFRDDLHTSLANYQWVELGRVGIDNSDSKTDNDVVAFEVPMERISALSLEAVDGDCRIHYLAVYDEKGQLRDEYNFRKEPRLLRHSLPRREVFHLWRRTTISRIVVENSRIGPRKESKPKLRILGGITERRELIKTALYHLSRARDSARNHDWQTTREALLNAKEKILDQIEATSRN